MIVFQGVAGELSTLISWIPEIGLRGSQFGLTRFRHLASERRPLHESSTASWGWGEKQREHLNSFGWAPQVSLSKYERLKRAGCGGGFPSGSELQAVKTSQQATA